MTARGNKSLWPVIQVLVRAKPLIVLRKFGKNLVQLWPWPVPVNVDGQRLYVDLRSVVGRSVLRTGDYDESVSALLRSELKPGAVFLDIGANIGVYSLMAARLIGDAGAVHAFEVDPRALRCLRKTQEANRLTNLIIHATALGNELGVINLEQTGDVGLTFIQASLPGKLQFPVIPLDSWMEYFRRRGVDLVKIDVEGAELDVLKGAEGVLRTCRPVVVCEAAGLQERFGSSPSDLVQFMESLGYEMARLEHAKDDTFVFRPAAREPSP